MTQRPQQYRPQNPVQPKGGSFSVAEISLHPKGLTLRSAFFRNHRLKPERYRFVRLYYGKARATLIIDPIESPAPGAKRIRPKKGTVSSLVECQGDMKREGIDVTAHVGSYTAKETTYKNRRVTPILS